MTPLQFLHILKSPFFGSFTRYPFFNSGIDGCNIYIVVIGSAFRASGGMPSGPGVFPSFNILSALLISKVDFNT